MPSLPFSTTANTVSTNFGVTALGVSSNFWTAYYNRQAGNEAIYGQIVETVPATTDQIKLAYIEAAPIARYMTRGRGAPGKAMKDVGWTIPVYEWSNTISWRWQDEQDDQTGSLVTMAKNGADKYWQREESNWFQYINASTDADGMPALGNAPDGVALFSATDGGGSARYGVSGGNIVSGQSFSSGAGIRAGYQAALSRLFRFQDTESQPLLNPDAKRFICFYSATDLAAVNEAFFQKVTAQAPTTATSNAGVSNLLLDMGYQVQVVVTQRLATGVGVVACLDTPAKPLVKAKRADPAEFPINMSNSDAARNQLVNGLMHVGRAGYGVGPAYSIIKVTT